MDHDTSGLLVMRPSTTLLALALISCNCARAPDQEVLAKVGREKIHASDLKALFDREGERYGGEILGHPEGRWVIKRQMLNRLITESLLSQEADKKRIRLPTGEDEKWKGLIVGQNPDPAWIERQRRKQKIELLIEQEIYSKIAPTAQEIKDYYRSHRSEFRVPEGVRCRQINTAKREKAEKILSLIRKGENFAALAQEYSESPDRHQGGDLGFLTRGEFPQVFEKTCFGLKQGETSGIVTSEYGFHIFRVTERRSSGTRSLDEASAEIVQILKKEKGDKRLQDWLDSLTRGTKIVVDEGALDRVSLDPTRTEEVHPS